MTTLAAIDGADLAPLRFELKRVAANSKMRWSEREGIVLTVRAGGAVGRGEASPLPGFSPDSLADARRDLERARDHLASSATLAIEGPPLDALRAVLAPIEPLVPSARFAVETALLDLRGRLRGVPVWRDLGGDPGAAPVPLSALLAGETDMEVATAAEDALARGLTTGKLKVGRPAALDREVGLASAARHASGGALRLRLDANGAWSVEEARAALAAFASFGPELVEEPVAGERWLELGPVPIPLAIDESAAAPGGDALLEAVLARGACEAVVVKLSTIGGFSAAERVVARAARAGRSVVVTHMFEGPLATAAAAAFAFARASRAHAAGLDVRPYVDLPEHHPIQVRDIVAMPEPGLGDGFG